MKQFDSVDEYISSFPEPAQSKLKKMQQIVKQAAPEAKEKISYGMPAYFLNGRLAYIGAFRDHLSLFPASSSAIETFKKDLGGYQTSKGTIRFPLDKPLPAPLIRKIVKYRVKQNLEKNK